MIKFEAARIHFLSDVFVAVVVARAPFEKIACVAWRFWLGVLSNEGGRGQRNRKEIGAGSPLARPARQNRHATQAFEKIAHMSVVWVYVSLWLCGFVCSDVCCRGQ